MIATSILEKTVEFRLRWLRHVEMMEDRITVKEG
jgi:hypothetical protein